MNYSKFKSVEHDGTYTVVFNPGEPEQQSLTLSIWQAFRLGIIAGLAEVPPDNSTPLLFLPGGFSEEAAARVAKAERDVPAKAAEELTDGSPMPFGKYAGHPMQDVPAPYLHWLWAEGAKGQKSPVALYIRERLTALKQEYPAGDW